VLLFHCMHVPFLAVSVRLYSVCLSVLLFISFFMFYGLLTIINHDDDDDDDDSKTTSFVWDYFE